MTVIRKRKRINKKTRKTTTISYEAFVRGIEQRGFDTFCVGSRQIKVDTTDFSKIDTEELLSQIKTWIPDEWTRSE